MLGFAAISSPSFTTMTVVKTKRSESNILPPHSRHSAWSWVWSHARCRQTLGGRKPDASEIYFSLSHYSGRTLSLPPSKLCTLSPLSRFLLLCHHLSFLLSLSKSLSPFSQNFNLIPLANQDLLRPIVRGQRGFSTHDQDALSLVVPVVVKVELAAFGRTLVQG